MYKSPIGKIYIMEQRDLITNLYFGENSFVSDIEFKKTSLLKEAVLQLEEYFLGKRVEFGLPLAPKGTDFQHAVWRELGKIPFGKTCSYKEIANKIGNGKACRAVGKANNKNPIPILIPCHRVIGLNGSLVGYAAGLKIKSFLLDMECKIL